MNDREKWVAANQGYDGLMRRQPRRPFTIPDCLLMIARIEPARVRRIPKSAIAEDGMDDEGEFSLVACPCGSRPVVRGNLGKCPGCERYYTHIRPGAVYVAYGAMSPPPLSPVTPEN